MIQYILAIGLPFLILMFLGPFLIELLKKFDYGQQVRGEGPESHYEKEGIPTMGGVLIILAVLLSAFFLLELNGRVLGTLLTMGGMGFIGLLDDLKKISRQTSLGLRAREKIIGQLLVASGMALYVYNYTQLGDSILVPGWGELVLGRWVIPLVILVIVGTTNAVNITDGLDGLASGITAITISALAIMVFLLNYQQLGLLGFIITGACIGFIWYNSHPAQVFMGDVGSLALGGALSALTVLAGLEVFLLITGMIFVVETVSVMIQVLYFRLTGGKRIFKMTPLHHHFELKGKEESKIVARFYIISMFFAGTGIILFLTTI